MSEVIPTGMRMEIAAAMEQQRTIQLLLHSKALAGVPDLLDKESVCLLDETGAMVAVVRLSAIQAITPCNMNFAHLLDPIG